MQRPPQRLPRTGTNIKRSGSPALLAAAAILVGAPIAPAAAQSAEETVAVMLWGLEEGEKTKRVAKNAWEAEDTDGERSYLSILRLTDCRFRIANEVQRAGASDVLEFDYILDFAAVNDYSVWLANGHDQRIIVKIEGHCWYRKTVRSKATGRVVYNIREGSIDTYVSRGGSVERLRSAFGYFRSAFCSKRLKVPDDGPPASSGCHDAAFGH
jgi:hypothetical protein